MAELSVLNQKISYIKIDDEDYISITDMLKSKDGDFFVSDWLRNRNTIEFWEFGKKFIILLLIMANLP